MRHYLDQIEGNEHGSAAISLPSDEIEHGEPIALSDYAIVAVARDEPESRHQLQVRERRFRCGRPEELR
jgi:hypothetical protein